MPWNFRGVGSVLEEYDEESVWNDEGYIPPGVVKCPDIPLGSSNYVPIDEMDLNLEED